jgi:hypothetical protein
MFVMSLESVGKASALIEEYRKEAKLSEEAIQDFAFKLSPLLVA